MSKFLPWFSAFGIEAEYMIVDKNTLDVKPIADEVIKTVGGSYRNELTFRETAWSNELVLHVLELKTRRPAKSIPHTLPFFHADIVKINNILNDHGAMLLPTGAHPWMNPATETKLWPHSSSPIYNSYDRIFNCSGHGWSNLQSVHLNLPFKDDHEFGHLHTAIRLLLPLIPAITASSPIIDGKPTGFLDTRLHFYLKNQLKIPSICGSLIPELVFTEEEYEDKILQKIYRDIAPYDIEGILQEEWLNSRGAIARFERHSIEIRVIDGQENITVDLSLLHFFTGILKLLTEEVFSSFQDQKELSTEELRVIFLDVISSGLNYVVKNDRLLHVLGLNKSKSSIREIYDHLLAASIKAGHIQDESSIKIISNIIKKGNLAERILLELKGDFSKPNLRKVYQKLAHCLEENASFSL